MSNFFEVELEESSEAEELEKKKSTVQNSPKPFIPIPVHRREPWREDGEVISSTDTAGDNQLPETFGVPGVMERTSGGVHHVPAENKPVSFEADGDSAGEDTEKSFQPEGDIPLIATPESAPMKYVYPSAIKSGEVPGRGLSSSQRVSCSSVSLHKAGVPDEDDGEVDGFWVEKKKEDYSVGLHGSNTEFVNKMSSLLTSAQKSGITDIHITEKKNVWIRTGGDMVKLNVITPQGGVSSFCSDVLRIPASYDKANSSCEHSGKRLRLRFSKSMHNNQLFVRILPGRAVPLAKIGHEETFEYLRGKIIPGIVFVAGATGSGKSTMLASVLQEYLNTEPVHISTVEDPVEYLLFDGAGEVSQREVPDDTPDFATAVKNVLREDPDIIFIGEMRDPETAKTAITAAETGHLVFATVHASGISGIIDRLLGMLADVNDASLRLSGAFLGGIYLKLDKQPDGTFLRKTRFLFADSEVRKKIREMKGFELDSMGQEIINK